MKKLLALILSMVMLLSFAACEQEDDDDNRDSHRKSKAEKTDDEAETTAPISEETEETYPIIETDPVWKPDTEDYLKTDALNAYFTEGYGDFFYLGSQSEYATKIGFEANQDLYYILYDVDAETGLMGNMLTSGSLYAGEVLVAKLEFPGDMSAYIISATDSEQTLFYYVGISGYDGSLEFSLMDI